MVAIESTQAHILAIEDEEAIREMLTMSLEREGHHVIGVSNVAAATQILRDTTIDVAIIDWMLPGGSGLEFVRLLRKSDTTRDLPVIMLTARTEEEDITAGLDAGADDYVTKPFSPRELNSRVKALLRRSKANRQSTNLLEVGPIALDTDTHRVTVNKQPLELGHTEFKLLRFLLANPERVYSRAQLLDHVWGVDTFIEERTVDVHILRLRKNLDPLGAAKMLETVRGAGYRLTAKTP